MTKRRSDQSVGQTIGGVLAGFDYQVFRTTPPPSELVRKGDPVREVAAEDGGRLTITLPGEGATATDQTLATDARAAEVRGREATPPPDR